MCLISLLDAERTFMLSNRGFEVRQVPRHVRNPRLERPGEWAARGNGAAQMSFCDR
jgi:hypothetical protein